MHTYTYTLIHLNTYTYTHTYTHTTFLPHARTHTHTHTHSHTHSPLYSLTHTNDVCIHSSQNNHKLHLSLHVLIIVDNNISIRRIEKFKLFVNTTYFITN